MATSARTAADFLALVNDRAKGKRPQYFSDPDADRLTGILMALAMEVGVLRERLDTVERLLEQRGNLRREDIENYVPDKDAGDQRAHLQQQFLARLLRIVEQEIQALNETEEEDLAVIAERMRDGALD